MKTLLILQILGLLLSFALLTPATSTRKIQRLNNSTLGIKKRFSNNSNSGKTAAVNTRRLKSKTDNQAKRDLSLSYSATDIGSKEGTHVKTITVIKNVFDKNVKQQPKINQELHKSEDWASQIRDNFDAYGAFPKVPDIDDLFDFVNRKKPKASPPKKPSVKADTGDSGGGDSEAGKKDDGEGKTAIKKSAVPATEGASNSSGSDGGVQKPSSKEGDPVVEKISGDAELIQSNNKPMKVKSQSLGIGKYRVLEPLTDTNFSETNQQGRQSSENYIQPTPYYYQKPGQNPPSSPAAQGFNKGGGKVGVGNSPTVRPQQGSFSFTTTSGRNYDIPIANGTAPAKPYIAPSVVRKNQLHPTSPAAGNSGNVGSQQRPPVLVPQLQFPSSSQRPYIAPNLRKTYEAKVAANNASTINGSNNQINGNTGRAVPPTYRTAISTNFRTNNFGAAGDYKPKTPTRFRGLKIK